MPTRTLALLFAAVLAAAAWFVLATTAPLPARVASHFGAGGNANAFMSHGFYRYYMLGFAVGFPLLLTGLIAGLPRLFPDRTNVPNRAYWMAPERRRETLAALARYALVFGCYLALFICAVDWQVVQANRLNPPRLAAGPFLVLLATSLATIAVWIVAVRRRFGDAARASDEAAGRRGQRS